MRHLFAALLCLAVAGAEARPLLVRGGAGTGAGTGPSSACDGGSSVCVSVKDGQSFVTWNDAATGASGANFRYRVYRSTGALNSGNCTSGTLIAKYIANNSAQLIGGDPNSFGATFTQSNRQNASQPMVKLTDLGTAVAAYTGLQVYTALANENAYYCVVSTDTGDASPAYIGAAGPVGETVATPQLIKYYASGSRPDNSYGTITGSCASGCPIVLNLHQSASSGGTPAYGQYGDYWWGAGIASEGFNDGRMMAWDVHQDNAQHYPSLTNSLEATNMATIWNGLGGYAGSPSVPAGIEDYHYGFGLTPNPLVGPANRLYLGVGNSIKRLVNWTASHYSADLNQVHCSGASMGAWGGANTCMRWTNPQAASVTMSAPVWRFDRRSCVAWPGTVWDTTDPFRATLDSGGNGCYLGTVASSVLMADGTVWGGNGNYADTPNFIATTTADLPAAIWMIAKDDPFPASFLEQIEAMAAFEASKHFYATCWFMGGHDTGYPALGLISRDWSPVDTTIAYSKALFRLDRMLPSFSNSSINDDPGTSTRDGAGIYDGALTGCKNVGFSWNVTSDTSGALNFTVDNAWMDRSPTANPSTTTTSTIGSSSGSGSVTVTNGAVFGSVSTFGNYFRIGNEVLQVSSVVGNTVNYNTFRGQTGTTASTHGVGETVTQYQFQPSGPSGGPYSTMTVDVTPRRIQGFTKGKTNGQVVSCNITPNGGSLTTQTPTVANNIFTLTGVIINSSGATTIACS